MTAHKEMTDKQLIGYCSLHCETPRALFHGKHINRMLKLAGYPADFVRQVSPDEWISVHEPMQELCKLASARLKEEENEVS